MRWASHQGHRPLTGPAVGCNLKAWRHQQLTEQVMALPLAERVDLAEALWQSIGEGLRAGGEQEAIEQATRRDAELTSGAVSGRTHEEVMQAARRAIGCG